VFLLFQRFYHYSIFDIPAFFVIPAFLSLQRFLLFQRFYHYSVFIITAFFVIPVLIYFNLYNLIFQYLTPTGWSQG